MSLCKGEELGVCYLAGRYRFEEESFDLEGAELVARARRERGFKRTPAAMIGKQCRSTPLRHLTVNHDDFPRDGRKRWLYLGIVGEILVCTSNVIFGT